MEPEKEQSEKRRVLEYAPPPEVPRRTIAQYISASVGAVGMFVAMTLLMAAMVGQSLDRIKGWQNICAAVAIYAIPAGVGILSFRASLKKGRVGRS